MRIQTKRTLQVALASGGLLMVGGGSAFAAETVAPESSVSPLDQVVTNPGLHDAVDTVNGSTDGLQPLQEVTGVDPRHPVQALKAVLPATPQANPAAVLHAVPVHLLQRDPAPSAEVSGEQPEQDLNAPLGSELAATDLPMLPVAVPLTVASDLTTLTPVDGRLPVRGTVTTQPLDPEAGTRVTGLHAAAPTETVQPVDEQRADTPAVGLPLVGGLLSSANLPALNGVPDVTRLTSLSGLTQLAGSTPLTRGGRYNTAAVTAPVTQHGPATLESVTGLLGK
ncbi:hypothetical protein AB0M83_14880 [Amycolatopsis sp. NPDC051106]|uniref:hypothetical protein n=1 Tax=unclassified Amycolatopsis TaxID=2618356 RepID=UPI0034437222